MKAKYPIIEELAEWAWEKSLVPYGTNIPLLPKSIDGYLLGQEHRFLVFENQEKDRILWKRLYPELDKSSNTFGFIKLDNSFFSYETGKFSASEPNYNLVLAFHTHPFTTGSVFFGNDGAVIGPSGHDFRTLYANPDAIGWIKSRTKDDLIQDFYFGNKVYPKN